jgi:hypothetical protein
MPCPIDARVIASCEDFHVLAQRHEIMFKDGSAVGVHPISVGGSVQPFLRALKQEGLCWVVFDLRHLHAALEADLVRALPSDVPSVVFCALRALYPRALDFAVAVQMNGLISWWNMPEAAAA